jgi:hypothetical protein
MVCISLTENKGWSVRTKDITVSPDDRFCYKQILHSCIHSFNIYLLRACYIYKAKKIKQNDNTMHFHSAYENTVSNKYKRQK